MKDYIINYFIINYKISLNLIFEYINLRFDPSITLISIQKDLKYLVKNKTLYVDNSQKYLLTEKGMLILNDHKYFYATIIVRFYKKYKNFKKYSLKEIRTEQLLLRTYLINNKEHKCILCFKKLPLCLLETAHLKPRCLLKNNEKYDKNIVEFMCRYCHTLYDNGLLTINKGMLIKSEILKNYDLIYENNIINSYNNLNAFFFNYHYNNIFNK